MKQETSKKALLEEITQVGFAVDEMTLYLDTHPYETEAIDYLTYYVRRCLSIWSADHRDGGSQAGCLELGTFADAMERR